MSVYDELRKLLNGRLAATYDSAAAAFLAAARRELAAFNLKRHLLEIAECGLQVNSLPWWCLRNEGQPAVVAIYHIGEALELLPEPVRDRLTGIIL